MLRSGTLIHPLPEDGSIKPLSDVKVQAEILYNRIPFSKLLFMFNLTVGDAGIFSIYFIAACIVRQVRHGAFLQLHFMQHSFFNSLATVCGGMLADVFR